jgi:hypothetical protein
MKASKNLNFMLNDNASDPLMDCMKRKEEEKGIC